MINQVFLTLPVADLQRSTALFKALGLVHNPQFSDDAAACIVISDAVSVMLGTHAKFREFTPKALAAGGTSYDKPEDLGFMDSHSFVDPDGHGWGVL